MRKLLYISIAVFIFVIFPLDSFAQYDCNKSYRTFIKQKRKIKKIANKTADEWLKQYKDTLHLAYELRKEKLSFAPPYEDLIWEQVDSVLCEKSLKIPLDSLFSNMKRERTIVYSITWKIKNPDEIEGEILLCFNIFGHWIYSEYCPDWSKFNCRYFHNKK